jgi:hypothetical protein
MDLWRSVALSVLAFGIGGCGGGNPSTPTNTTPQVGGNWTGTTTLTSVSGGECVGALLQGTVGSSAPVSVSVQQAGSSLTATIVSQSNGLTCSYSGSVSGSTVILSLTSCQANAILALRCGNGGRDIVLIGSSITATLNGNALTGSEAETWNVFVAGTSTGVGVLSSGESFTLHK